MNITAIIQARTGSTRFNNKVLKKLYDKTLLEHIIERIEDSKLINSIVVATTTSKEDDEIEDLFKDTQIKVFRGSENNVLERFYLAAKKENSDIIIRVTADDPFKDPEIIDKAINILKEGNYDYVSNTLIPTYPEGIDIEVFTFIALKKAFLNANIASEKEHVTPYIWNNKDLFSIKNFKNQKDLSKLRWTIDYDSDFVFAKKIYEELYSKKKIFLMDDILNVVDKKHIINKTTVERNEGYKKSIKEEK